LTEEFKQKIVESELKYDQEEDIDPDATEADITLEEVEDLHRYVASEEHHMEILDQIYKEYCNVFKTNIPVGDDKIFGTTKIYEDYMEYKENLIKNKKSKKNKNEDFLIDKLKKQKRTVQTKSLKTEQMNKYCSMMKEEDHSEKNSSGVNSYFLSALTPQHIKVNDQQKKVDKKQFVDEENLEDITYKKRVLVLSTCAY
jgi:hypothetical protein